MPVEGRSRGPWRSTCCIFSSRSLVQAISAIGLMCEHLGLKDNVRGRACELFKQASRALAHRPHCSWPCFSLSVLLHDANVSLTPLVGFDGATVKMYEVDKSIRGRPAAAVHASCIFIACKQVGQLPDYFTLRCKTTYQSLSCYPCDFPVLLGRRNHAPPLHRHFGLTTWTKHVDHAPRCSILVQPCFDFLQLMGH